MRRLTLTLACTALLAAAAAAQTAPATASEPVLEIHGFDWYETVGNVLDFREGGAPSLATVRWRLGHAPGRGNYGVVFVLKNVSRRPIKSVGVRLDFRDAETDEVFLTYQARFDRRIGPGEKKRLRHTVKKGEEPGSFSPAAPSGALLARTSYCGDRTLVYDRQSGKLVKRKVRAGQEPVRNVCFARPSVTHIDYEDGTFRQP